MTPAATGFWYLGFLLTGTLTTLLGPILPQLSQAWRLNDSQAGVLFAAQFLASLAGSLMGGTVAARLGAKRVVGGGLLICVAGLLLAALLSWPFGACGVPVWGLGLGLVIPLVNVTVAGLHATRRAEALNVLNFVWGLGAVTSGPMVAVVARFGLQRLLLTLAAVVFGSAAGVLFSACELPRPEQRASAGKTTRPIILICWTGLFLFLYVGVENGLSGWLPTYMTRELGTLVGAAWTQAGFWTALLAGRLIVPMLLRGGNARAVMLAGLLTAAGGLCVLVALNSAAAAWIGASLAGLGLSGLFPTAVALFTERAGQLGTQVTGVVFSMAALGGVTLPWLIGVASTRLGSIRWALATPWFCVAVMTAVVGFVNPWRAQR